MTGGRTHRYRFSAISIYGDVLRPGDQISPELGGLMQLDLPISADLGRRPAKVKALYVCPGCRRVLPRSDFGTKSCRGRKLPATYCRACKRERDNRRYLSVKAKRSASPNYAIYNRLQSRIRKKLGRDLGCAIRLALKRGGRSKKVEALLGYMIDDVRRHIEQRFLPGMNWEAFCRGEIHIDHDRPVKLFDMRDPIQWRACWALSNLQPLWARDNLSKGARHRGTGPLTPRKSAGDSDLKADVGSRVSEGGRMA